MECRSLTRRRPVLSAIERLIEIVDRLRGPEGCPWDRSQTLQSLRPYLLEEAHEVLDALDEADPDSLCGELGDLLFQILLLARIAQDDGSFSLEDVATRIADKMEERHPHVFDPDFSGEEDPGSVAAWEARKARQRGPDGSMLDGIPRALPALLRAHRMGEKVARVGFDWPSLARVRDKVDEEIQELDEAIVTGDEGAIAHEYGDLLLAAANLGRFLALSPEDALRQANNRFARRFRDVERQASTNGVLLHELELEALEVLWQQAKQRETL